MIIPWSLEKILYSPHEATINSFSIIPTPTSYSYFYHLLSSSSLLHAALFPISPFSVYLLFRHEPSNYCIYLLYTFFLLSPFPFPPPTLIIIDLLSLLSSSSWFFFFLVFLLLLYPILSSSRFLPLLFFFTTSFSSSQTSIPLSTLLLLSSHTFSFTSLFLLFSTNRTILSLSPPISLSPGPARQYRW